MFGRGVIRTGESSDDYRCERCDWTGTDPRRHVYGDYDYCPDCGDEVELAE